MSFLSSHANGFFAVTVATTILLSPMLSAAGTIEDCLRMSGVASSDGPISIDNIRSNTSGKLDSDAGAIGTWSMEAPLINTDFRFPASGLQAACSIVGADVKEVSSRLEMFFRCAIRKENHHERRDRK